MAHTVMKEIYDEQRKKYVKCEILVFDEEEQMPGTDRREIMLSCTESEEPFSELSDTNTEDINNLYPETELIDQYEDFENRR